MNIKDIQDLVAAWEDKNPVNGGELTRIGNIKTETTTKAELTKGLAEELWQVVSVANNSEIDLTQAFIDSLNKRNIK